VQGTARYSRDVLSDLFVRKENLEMRWGGKGFSADSSLSGVDEVIMTGFPSQLQMLVDWSVDLTWNYVLGASSSDP